MFLIEPGSELTTSRIRVLILGFGFYFVCLKNGKKKNTHTTIIIVLHYLSSIKYVLILMLMFFFKCFVDKC